MKIELFLFNFLFLTIAKRVQNNDVKVRLKPKPFACDSNTEFKCLNTQKCIELTQVCDKIFDCPDRSDEYNCNCKY